MLFRDFPDGIRTSILQEAKLLQDEEPAILAYLTPMHWVLLTNGRIFWRKDNDLAKILYEAIEKVIEPGFEELWQMKLSSFNNEIINHELKFTTQSGQLFHIDMGKFGERRFTFIDAFCWAVRKVRQLGESER